MKQYFFLLFLPVFTAFSHICKAQTAYEYINLGIDLEELGAFNQAMVYYDSALLLEPENAIALYNRGSCAMIQGFWGDALVDFNSALNIDSSIADAYYNRSLVHQNMNNSMLALLDMQYYTELQPYDTLGYLALIDLEFKLGEYAKVIKSNQKLMELGFNRKFLALRSQGMAYYFLENPSMAEYLLANAINHNPKYIDAYLDRAMVRIELEDYYEALFDLSIYLENYPRNIQALSMRVACSFNTQNYQNALNDLLLLQELEPYNMEWVIEIGNCYLKLKEDFKAVQFFSKAIDAKYEQKYAWIYMMRGIAFHNLKNYSDACIDWNMAKILGDADAVLLSSKWCNND